MIAENGGNGENAKLEARVGYRQAIGTISKAKTLLTAEVERQSKSTPPLAKASDLEDLRKDATLLMARVSTKRGCISARVSDHYPALVRCQCDSRLYLVRFQKEQNSVSISTLFLVFPF